MEEYEVDDRFVSESGHFDLTLIVDKHKIQVSKTVLCIASPVFRAMLESDFKEKGQNEVQLPGKKYADFVKFLCCIYPDRIESVTGNSVYGILPLAVEYQVKALEKRCHTFLIQLVRTQHLADAVEIYHHIQLAEMYKLDGLNRICTSIASEFSLKEIERAASKYQITERSLIQIHHLARMREELNKIDDEYLKASGKVYEAVNYTDFIRKDIEARQHYRDNKGKLRAVRLWSRYFRNENKLLEKFITDIKDMVRERARKARQPSNRPIKEETFPQEELDLLPEKIKQMLDLH